MINNNNNNNGHDSFNYTDTEKQIKSVSFFELAEGAHKRITYVYLCLILGMFGIHELYARRAIRSLLFFIFGAVSFFSGMILLYFHCLKYLTEENINYQFLYSGIVLISVALVTFIVCIITALKWMFFNNDDDFENIIKNNSKAPLNKQ